MSWPDILIGGVLLIAALKGYKRGFIMELSGAVALALALVTPWLYNGTFDGRLESASHIGPGAAHVVAMFLVGGATYVAVLLFARVLSAVARLPVLGLGNAVAGTCVALLKATILIWVVLYVALFFPLSHDIRTGLHRSVLAGYITKPNTQVDARIIATLPLFARQYAAPIFARHHV